jgi:hypothetical protein
VTHREVWAIRTRTDLSRLAGGLLLALVATSPAWASFKSAPAAVSHSISTGTLAAPTGLAATCSLSGTSTNVSLTWTATVSTIATGYVVLRGTTTGGPYSQIGTTVGINSTSFTDTIAPLATQYYVVKASRNLWTSAISNQAGVHNIALGVCTAAS